MHVIAASTLNYYCHRNYDMHSCKIIILHSYLTHKRDLHIVNCTIKYYDDKHIVQNTAGKYSMVNFYSY